MHIATSDNLKRQQQTGVLDSAGKETLPLQRPFPRVAGLPSLHSAWSRTWQLFQISVYIQGMITETVCQTAGTSEPSRSVYIKGMIVATVCQTLGTSESLS